MKFLAIFVTLLGFAPTILDHTLSAARAPAPTRVFPTKTYDPSNVFNARKAVLQVPPTSASRVHHMDNVGQIGSAISVSTALGATSDHTVASTGDAIIDANRHLLQRHWNNLHHLRRIDFGWVITACLLLLPFLTVGTALLHSLQSEPVVIVPTPLEPSGTVECQLPTTRTTYRLTFPTRGLIVADPRIPNTTLASSENAHRLRSPVEDPQITSLVDSRKGTVDQPVALKQPHRIIAWITLFAVEGFLSMDPCSPDSDSGNAGQWTLTFHPRDRSCPTPSPTHPNALVDTNERLLNILYHGTPAYHPWAPQLTSVLNIPGHIVNEPSEEVGLDATVIVPPITPTPATAATPAQTVPNADVVEEDGLATHITEENKLETHHKKSKPHRGGRRVKRMKRHQAALHEAEEAPEAGPSGPN